MRVDRKGHFKKGPWEIHAKASPKNFEVRIEFT